jgi:hypothetical protein
VAGFAGPRHRRSRRCRPSRRHRHRESAPRADGTCTPCRWAAGGVRVYPFEQPTFRRWEGARPSRRNPAGQRVGSWPGCRRRGPSRRTVPGRRRVSDRRPRRLTRGEGKITRDKKPCQIVSPHCVQQACKPRWTSTTGTGRLLACQLRADGVGAPARHVGHRQCVRPTATTARCGTTSSCSVSGVICRQA